MLCKFTWVLCFQTPSGNTNHKLPKAHPLMLEKEYKHRFIATFNTDEKKILGPGLRGKGQEHAAALNSVSGNYTFLNWARIRERKAASITGLNFWKSISCTHKKGWPQGWNKHEDCNAYLQRTILNRFKAMSWREGKVVETITQVQNQKHRT